MARAQFRDHMVELRGCGPGRQQCVQVPGTPWAILTASAGPKARHFDRDPAVQRLDGPLALVVRSASSAAIWARAIKPRRHIDLLPTNRRLNLPEKRLALGEAQSK
jgi:hypothetical protein